MASDGTGFEDYDVSVIRRRWSADYGRPLNTDEVMNAETDVGQP